MDETQQWTDHHIIISIKTNPDAFIKAKHIAGWIERALRLFPLASYDNKKPDVIKQTYGVAQIRVLAMVAKKKPELSEVLIQLSADGSTP